MQRSFTRKLLVAGAIILVSIVAAELCLRACVRNRYREPIDRARFDESRLIHRNSAVAGLDYELKPNVDQIEDGVRVRTNSLGMRGPEMIATKPDSLLRVAIVGDSVSFGLGVENEETFPSLLQSMLNERCRGRARRYEVLNLAVTGYSSQDESVVVRSKALLHRPDLLIVGYYLNDPEDEPVQQLHLYFRPPQWWEHSHLLRFLAREKRSADQLRYGGGDLFRHLHADPAKWRNVLRAFDDIRESTRAQNVKVLLAVLPTLYRSEASEPPSDPAAHTSSTWSRWDEYPYRDIHHQVIEAAAHADFETIDLLDAYAASGRAPIELRGDGDHPNAAGHAILARALMERIVHDHTLLFGVDE
jgi:lysophospholipase L1-like esterase